MWYCTVGTLCACPCTASVVIFRISLPSSWKSWQLRLQLHMPTLSHIVVVSVTFLHFLLRFYGTRYYYTWASLCYSCQCQTNHIFQFDTYNSTIGAIEIKTCDVFVILVSLFSIGFSDIQVYYPITLGMASTGNTVKHPIRVQESL